MDNLIKLLTPPVIPLNTGDEEQWKHFFGVLGTELPTDYIKFIQTYGTGGVDNFLWILTPFLDDENVNFLRRQKEMAEAYIQSKTSFPEYFKHDVFPEVGGLLPWAYTDNGDELYWLTDGKPDEWKVVVYESRSSEYRTYSLNMTEFLFQILSKELVCDIFPEDFPSDEFVFVQ